MTRPAPDGTAIATALLGSWPQHVSAWGPEAIQAYINELEHRGLEPASILDAIRTWPTPADPAKDFPPSAPALAQHAMRDPDSPAFAEVWRQLTGPDGVLRARTLVQKGRWEPGERDEADLVAMEERLSTIPLRVQEFVEEAGGLAALRARGVLDPEWREPQRRRLEKEWERFVDTGQRRRTKQLVTAAGGAGQLRSVPNAAIGQEGDGA